MIKSQDAIRIARSLLGTPYAELDCINLIKKVIRTAPGGVKTYTTAGTNALWRSYDMSAKYKDLTWRREGITGALAGMIAFKADGEDYHHAGIVTDVGTVIHSSSTQGGRGVVETPLTTGEGWTHLAIHRYIITKDEAEEAAPMYKATVNLSDPESSLNLRSGPNTSNSVIGSIPHGAEVDVLVAADDWSYVRYNGRSGYAASAYLAQAAEEEPAEETKAVTVLHSLDSGVDIEIGGSWIIKGDD